MKDGLGRWVLSNYMWQFKQTCNSDVTKGANQNLWCRHGTTGDAVMHVADSYISHYLNDLLGSLSVVAEA